MTYSRLNQGILRDAIISLPAYQSGLSIDAVRQASGVEKVVKLDSNENPFGPSVRAMNAAQAAALEAFRYPDRDETRLREILAQLLDVKPEQFVFSGGSEDVLAILYRIAIRPGDVIATVTPGFGLHAICAQICEAQVEVFKHKSNWCFPIEELMDCAQRGARIIALSSPSNPIGAMLTLDEIDLLLSACGEQTLVIFDEAYIEFAGSTWTRAVLERLESHRGPWAVLRTFAKAYGLAAMRIGYGVVHDAEFAAAFAKTRSPFNVNAVALASAESAVLDQEHMQTCVSKIIEERERVGAEMAKLGFVSAPSQGNFLFVDVNQSSDAAADSLKADGVLVKPWREAGYETFIRVTIGLPDENDALLGGLAKL